MNFELKALFVSVLPFFLPKDSLAASRDKIADKLNGGKKKNNQSDTKTKISDHDNDDKQITKQNLLMSHKGKI